MNFMLDIDQKRLPEPISYSDSLLLIGSCFTEHIGNALLELKFNVLQNPSGILFGPDSVCSTIHHIINNQPFVQEDLFQSDEIWHSWRHHSRFSGTDPDAVLSAINTAQEEAHQFLKISSWLIITLGSSFTYRLTEAATKASLQSGAAVANCHRAPSGWFSKELLEIDSMESMMETLLTALRQFNPAIRVLFTISPVRHIRDGVVENNRSKARLIETVSRLLEKHSGCYYFPAYELVIDVLRDYRFYDIDLVHPNYAATSFVLEKFTETCIAPEAQLLMQEIKKLVIARKHKPFQPATHAHRQFLAAQAIKTRQLMQEYPFLDLRDELQYFEQAPE